MQCNAEQGYQLPDNLPIFYAAGQTGVIAGRELELTGTIAGFYAGAVLTLCKATKHRDGRNFGNQDT